jgi:hypothetical protein
VQALEELLGQDALAAQLIDDLNAPDALAVRLTGAAGSGKSYVARLVAKRWREEGGDCVVAIGDDEHASRELYPLLSGLSRTPRDWAGLASVGTRSVVRLADSVAGGPGVGTTIFDLLTAAFRQQTERVLRPYSILERDVILDLKRLARRGRLLLVADNCHWWDGDSLRLLSDILSEDLRESIPRLQGVSALVVDTAEEQPVMARDAFVALTAKHVACTRLISRCTLAQFPAVLRAFGLEELPGGVLGDLFGVTHGHLKLAQQVAAYAEHSDIATLTASLGDKYLTTLVSARFASLGALQPAVSDLLVRSAILGLSFTEQDLMCIADAERVELRPLLERAESIGFIERSSGTIGFTHDVIRLAILVDESPSRLEALYAKLAECLAILRPGDFDARAHALQQAGESQRARDMRALSRVGQIRRGSAANRVLRRAAIEHPDDPDLTAYLAVIAQGYAAVGSGDYAAAVPNLRTPIAGESTLMAAERNYLLALCSMLLQTAAGAAEARAILSSWISDLGNEVAVELRFLLLLQQGQLISEMFDEARETERTLERRLLDRARYDPEAAAMLQVQNRRAGAIDVPEVADKRIRAAVAFFQRGTGDAIRDRLELFRSLTNLAAVELRLGRDEDAHIHAQEAERIVLESSESLHRLDVLANNVVLAGVRSGAIELSEAVSMQRTIVESRESEDRFLERCNLSAYLLLASDDQADAELEQLQAELHSRAVEESYLVYYCSALWAASAVLRGDREEAIRRHRDMEGLVNSIKWPCGPYVRRRQRLLADLLPVLGQVDSRVTADRVLLESHPEEIGVCWAYYGRLVPCVELSFWSDS